jgi:C1A family cysteine protease
VAAGKVTPVKNQGSACAASYAFAATASVESAKLVFNNATYNLSEKQLLDCSQIYGNMGCNGGSVYDSYIYMYNKGIATSQAYPWNNTSGCHTVLNAFKISSYAVVNNTCDSLTTVLTSQPIAVNVDATNWAPYQTGIFSNCSNNLNFAALLVGQTGDYWTLKNAWGTTWGEAGYIRLAPGDTCGVCDSAWYPIL